MCEIPLYYIRINEFTGGIPYMPLKKKIGTAIVAVLLVGIVLAVVLLGIFFGTRNNKNGIEYFQELYEVPIERFSESLQITVDKTDGYLGHPDLLLNEAGQLITMYPLSHGKGQLAVKTSDDSGKTWSERLTDIPKSWTYSQETPTLYNLEFTNGEKKILLVSGCPYWEGIDANGFNCSLSTDDGKTWTEFENFYGIKWGSANGKPAFDGIVAMSSLTRLKENGSFIDRWMGTFHDHGFNNYKTFLTFDENGAMQWTEPERIYKDSASHEIETKTGMCEIEIVRTPNADGSALTGDTLILIARANNRISNSMISYSDDEGETWTKPKELPYCLTGDRHKAEYNPSTGILALSFRSYRQEPLSKVTAGFVKRTAGWVCWIGGFEDLLSYRDADADNDTYGKKVVVLGTDYTYTGDCGYTGTALVADGSFVMLSYGYFEKDAANPYIMAVRFKVTKDGIVTA